eukprot:CAMPEP_0115882078 /NCGR_PEP_ID=MMETSP0287-20121206/28799_1 /TAXON_ID=412157 /ORGANISM="Chrysochromulina rotalis, Strain UIO044" /LENGTH=541 /DNA_ID=CAMNT_0003338105 /DNA_START=69 /DNA_END=1694 /DNA_ORIENTATION=+
MTTMMPNMPTALMQPPTSGSDESARTFTCYTAPGVVFASEEEMKDHYRSDWHRYNLKRKVAGLAPLPFDAYELRAAREEAATAGSGTSRSQQRRLKREAKSEAKAAAKASNPNSKAAHYEATKTMSEHDYVELKMATAEDFDEGSDLFSRHHSPSLEANLAYMAKTHGFYIPYIEYVTDLPGLMGYLLEMVYVGNVALLSGKQFHSLEAVQGHMRDRRECRMELEGHEEEYEAWYDLHALANKSPLWEWVEEEDSDDDDDDDDEEDDSDGNRAASSTAADAAMAEVDAGPATAAGASGGGMTAVDVRSLSPEELEEMLSELFDQCVRVRLLSEAQVDSLTDQVCTGEATDAQLYTEWSAKLADRLRSEEGGASASEAAFSAAARPADAMSVATSARSTRWTVRYRPVGGGAAGSGPDAEVGALRVRSEAGSIRADGSIVPRDTARELGHRAMKTFYRQKFRPGHGDGISGVSNPEMHALMVQYSNAGVLAHPMPAAKAPAAKFERNRAQVNLDKKMMVRQGDTNNLTAPGRKHFKNQSLNF